MNINETIFKLNGFTKSFIFVFDFFDILHPHQLKQLVILTLQLHFFLGSQGLEKQRCSHDVCQTKYALTGLELQLKF
jgi:hypothetical protein